MPPRKSSRSPINAQIQQILNKNAGAGHAFTVLAVDYGGRDYNGKPYYRIRIRQPNGQVMVRTHTYSGGELGRADMRVKTGEDIRFQQLGQQRAAHDANALALNQAKSRWLAWLADNRSMMSTSQFDAFKANIEKFGGNVQDLNNSMSIASRNLRFGSTGQPDLPPDDQPFDPLAGLDLGGFGGGGGFARPEYVKPDERVVEDFVKGALTSLVGTVPDELVGGLVKTYMTDHRRNYDVENEEIDPSQSVILGIRATKEYRTIHQLRPDSEDERSWVASRRSAAQQGGLNQGDLENFAITQATVGGDLADVHEAAGVAQFQASGSMRGTSMEQKLRNVMTDTFAGVVI